MARPRRITTGLANRSPGDVAAELAEVRAEIARLELEEQLLVSIQRFLEHAATQNEPKPEPGTISSILQGMQAGNLSTRVLSLVEQAHEPMTPSDVQARLARAGVEADTNAIRVALRRWVERDKLRKEGRHYMAARDYVEIPTG